jgi:hypothetical protein
MDRPTIALFLRKLIRFVGTGMPLLLLMASGCSYILLPDPPNRRRALKSDAMEEGSRKLVGTNAVDCGRVTLGKDPKTATDCALGAFKADKAFRVPYDLRGIDSSVASGLVRTPDGKLYAMSFDGDPMGGGGISPTRQRFTTAVCPQPVSLRVTEDGLLNCFPPSNEPGEEIKKPTFPSY